MLKKIITLGLITGVSTGSLVACSNNSNNNILSKAESKYTQYMTLGNYKGIEVTKVDRSNETISDEEVAESVQYIKDSFPDYDTVDISEEGDTVVINSIGYIDGEEIENGKLEDFEYEIGSEQLIEGFDEGLLNKKANEEFDLTATFPEDYGDEKLNGKEAIFKTTIKEIKRIKETELNDEWVKNHSKDIEKVGYTASTVDELKTQIRIKDSQSAKQINDQQIAAEALETIIENSTFNSYPEEEIKTYTESITSNVKSEFENYGDNYDSFDAFLAEAYELDNEAALEEYAREQAQEYMKNKMTITLIAANEGIVVTDDEVKDFGNQMATYYGFENYDKMVEEFGEEVKEDFAYQTLFTKVAEYLASVSNPVKETEAIDDNELNWIEDTENTENSEEIITEETEEESAEEETQTEAIEPGA